MRIFFAILFFSLSSSAQKPSDTVLKPLFREIVQMLSNDSLKGRATGSIEEIKSLAYIEEVMKTFSKATYFERNSFTIKRKNKQTLNAVNGFCFVDNHSDKTIVIGAHYDHIGLGGLLSTQFKSNEIHNGADDNASGVAILIGLASELIKEKNAKVNYLLVFYSGHEIGLYGSAAFSRFIQKRKPEFKTISLVVNLDMLGRMDPDLKILKCTKSISSEGILEKVNENNYGLKLNYGEAKQLQLLDTKSFDSRGIPCLNFTTGVHLDYHTPNDDAQYINFDGMIIIEHYLMQLITSYPPS
jgi:Zn-dependent M28 family amino/carboxypeptidase